MAYPGFDTPAYGTISGFMPWGGGGNPAAGVAAAGSGNINGIAQSYGQQYNNALAMNQSQYQNILTGYQQTLASQSTAQQAIQSGYSNLYNDVLAKINSVGQASANNINAGASKLGAQESQQLIDRGLGNTTIQSSVDRGVEADRQQRQLELSDSLAKMSGDYMSQLGLAGLQNQQQGLNNATGLAGRQLDFMNSMNSKYPDAGLYSNLAQMAGQNAGNKQNPMSYGGGSFGGAGGPPPKVGYVPSGGPYYGAGGSDIGQGVGGGGSWLMDQYSAPASYGYGDYTPMGAGAGGGGLGMLGGAMQPEGNYAGAIGGAIAGGFGSYGDYGGGGDF